MFLGLLVLPHTTSWQRELDVHSVLSCGCDVLHHTTPFLPYVTYHNNMNPLPISVHDVIYG